MLSQLKLLAALRLLACAALATALGAACSASPTIDAAADAATAEDARAATEDADGFRDAARSDAQVADAAAEFDPPGSVRSTLFPRGWMPGFQDAQGRYLHDFSYAGYRGGERVPTPSGTRFRVADYGARGDGSVDDRAAIARAIAAASSAGGVVEFAAGSYRIDGTLSVQASNVVLLGAGAATKLLFNQTAGMSSSAHLSFQGNVSEPVKLPLAKDARPGDTSVYVASSADLVVGDDVVVGHTITPEFIAAYGMTGVWVSFAGQYKPVHRRTIVAINRNQSPVEIVLDEPLRSPLLLRDLPELRVQRGALREVGLMNLAIGNAGPWNATWATSQVFAVRMHGVQDAFVQDVQSSPTTWATGRDGKPSTTLHLMSGGIKVEDSKRVTIERVVLSGAQHRGTGGNGYLFEISRSNDILTTSSEGARGRHNFIQNWDFGTNGCVWLRCKSSESRAFLAEWDFIGLESKSEFHHSLATANLIDSSTLDDGWIAHNRGSESSGAGISATENVFWNTRGTGTIQSRQYGWGYVIGTAAGLNVDTALIPARGDGTAPEDFREHLGQAGALFPQSLYDEQRRLRLQRARQP